MAEDKKTKKAEVKLSAGLQKIIDQIEKLNVLELAELVKALEEKFGVSPMAMQAAPANQTSASGEGQAAGQAGAPAEEKTDFKVVLASSGANKIAVIKAVREIKPDLGLKEAKDLVEAAPKELLDGVKKEEADEAKKKLEQAGAQVELK